MSKKLLIVIIPVTVLLICCLGALLFVSGNTSVNEEYMQKITTARKCLAENDIDGAIKCYRAAIELDKTQEEPYISLSEIYYNMQDLDQAINVLKLGSENTNHSSAKIENALAKYLSEAGQKDGSETKANAEPGNIINTLLLDVLSKYNYGMYHKNYTIESERYEADSYIVKYVGMDIEFKYFNTNDNSSIINAATNKPYDNAMPAEIYILNAKEIFPDLVNGTSYDEIKNLGVNNLFKSYDKGKEKNLLSFEYMNCRITVECDENGNVKGDNLYNKIEPLKDVNTKTEPDLVTVSGKIISVTDGKLVNNVKLEFRDGQNNKTGSPSYTCNAQNGEYSVELAAGNYTVKVFADGFNEEFFDLQVLNSGKTMQRDFSISPTLAAGEIRIVLEWEGTPRDLDSHLEGNSSDGHTVDISFMNKTVRYGDKVYAELDIDKTSGYGPETITLSEIAGKYTYRVHNFSKEANLNTSNAVVKVYMNGQSQPAVIRIPENISGEWWEVFTIENGELKNINGQ